MKLPWLFYLLFFVQVSTMLMGGFRYRSLSFPLRILAWLVLMSVVDTVGTWILILLRIPTIWISHFYTLLELVLISMIYVSWIKLQSRKKILHWSLAGFTLLWIISKFSFEPLSHSDDLTATISKVIQIAFSIYVLIEVIHESDILWTDDPRIWVASSIMLYAAGIIFWYALFQKMLQVSPELLRKSYSLNWTLQIISNLLFVRGFLCKK